MNGVEFLIEAQSAYQAGDYVRALEILSQAEFEGKTSPELLLVKAACIQLSENTDFSIAKALETYAELSRLRPLDPRPWSEMAFFLLNVGGDAVRARACFSNSIAIYGELLVEACRGFVRASVEIGSPEASALADARELVQRIQDEIEAGSSQH